MPTADDGVCVGSRVTPQYEEAAVLNRKVACTLMLVLLMIPVVPVIVLPFSSTVAPRETAVSLPDFHALAKTFGEDIPLVVRFSEVLSPENVAKLTSMGIRFSFQDPELSSVGDLYLLRGDSESLDCLAREGFFSYVGIQTPVDTLQFPRDVSIPDIEADEVWRALDGSGRNITGQDVLVADLDSGVDWTHPDLWFADGGVFNWIDDNTDGSPTNGTDGIDLNCNGFASANETLGIIDLDHDGSFNATTDWVWAENASQDGTPQLGEPFFVVNDTNGNDKLDVGEKLIMLSTPKTKYIVERDGLPSCQIQVWERGTNLTISTHEDTDGHGTSVSGILLGGQIGYRKYVGVAPDAELMMIRIYGAVNTTLTVEEGLTWAVNHGADLILIEIGSWTYHYLDGSGSCSAAETMIDAITDSGVPVIVPSGNLGGSNKHALFNTPAYTPRAVDFDVPGPGPIEYRNIWITVLSRNNTDFALCNFTLRINFASWGIPQMGQLPLTPGKGYMNFTIQPLIVAPGTVWVESFISTSARFTRMLGIHIWTQTMPIPTTGGFPPFHQLVASPSAQTTFHCYIYDDQSSWSGGVTWASDQSDAYHITWPSTADSAISVASYHTRNLLGGTVGDIASYSGIGPRIDEVLKQGVAAPGGLDVISDYTNASQWAAWYNANGQLSLNPAFGGYRLFSGTSAAGPHVAGCAALMLQAKPSAGSQVSDIIKSAARTDAFTGAVPNAVWGSGKLNVSGALDLLMSLPTIGIPKISPAAPTSSDVVTVNVTVTDALGVDAVILEYYNGSMWINTTMVLTGVFYLGTIPTLPQGTNVTYRIHANDTVNNWAESPDYSYEVQTWTTTTTTTSTTTTTTTQPTPDYFRLALFLGALLALVLIAVIVRRRKPGR